MTYLILLGTVEACAQEGLTRLIRQAWPAKIIYAAIACRFILVCASMSACAATAYRYHRTWWIFAFAVGIGVSSLCVRASLPRSQR